MTQITQILERGQQGDSKAAEELLPMVYEELRLLARGKMAHDSPGQTLQATALRMRRGCDWVPTRNLNGGTARQGVRS